MQLTKFFLPLLLPISIVSATEEDPEPFTELSVHITKRVAPEDCKIKATNGDVVKVHYTGRFRSDGKVFDSSVTRGVPFTFRLGAGQVIKGWDQGILGMCVGEARTLKIPAELAYGARGIPGAIPANADMIFDVTLLDASNSN